MKTIGGRLLLSLATVLICSVAFMALFYAVNMGFLSSTSFLKLVPCSKKDAALKLKKKIDAEDEHEIDDRSEFDQEECNTVSSGKWVFNSSRKPLYTDWTCPYLEKQVTCSLNGRPDSGYLQWEWRPNDCFLPRFEPRKALEKIRGKRMMFVGDSLQRGQWQSMVCMVEFVIPEKYKSMHRNASHYVFRAKEYNASIEFYWAPYLVESNSDEHIIGDANKRILRVDSVSKHAQKWRDVDILIFNSFIWWMNGPLIKSLWGNGNGEEGYEEIERPVAYRMALRTWANWLDSNLNGNKTRVFFTTMSPVHMRSADWNKNKNKKQKKKNKNGIKIKCYNETKPVTKVKNRMRWSSGGGYSYRMTDIIAGVVKKMKTKVTLLNITEMSEYRPDAHTSVYSDNDGGNLLSSVKKADPQRYADCIHWCLPGLPDTWNHILYAYL